MKVLFVALKWDYKDPGRGSSFEVTNFWHSLRKMKGVDATFFPFDEIEARSGRSEMNRLLLSQVKDQSPDLVFFFLFEEEFDRRTIEEITRLTTTLNWFADDHWRFDGFSRFWAPLFTWVATTDPEALPKYRGLGLRRIALTQWACNHHLYEPTGVPTDIPTSFVGQAHGSRKRTIRRLRSAGVEVMLWGHGWPAGRLSIEDMIDVFNRSKINLNLSNASHSLSASNVARLPIEIIKAGVKGRGLTAPLRRLRASARDQIKGRNFEVPGTGAFLLTSHIPELANYYALGEEVATFSGTSDLIAKVTYFLDHDEDRRAIAARGLRRTLAEHTYEHRFTALVAEMGLI